MSFNSNVVSLVSPIAIEACGIGKCYNIYERPSDRIKQALFARHRKFYKEFWALKNASFQIDKGGSLGIIGRNGSGKSTLLQIICGTLSPTCGTVLVNGRVGALLELGSGFNPEFTGLENIYLNASILGASKKETDARLDDILGFADIGEFINQAVKTYSSGMAVRLAFAIASCLEPSILVVDEALSVGDSFFTSKCRKRMMALRETGTTMLVVSHDLEQLASLCDKAVLIESGYVSEILPIRQQIHRYLSKSEVSTETDNAQSYNYESNSASLIEPVDIQNQTEHVLRMHDNNNQGQTSLVKSVDIDGTIVAESAGKIECLAPTNSVLTIFVRASAIRELSTGLYSIGIILQDLNGLSIWSACKFLEKVEQASTIQEEVSVSLQWPPLKNGTYFIVVGIGHANSKKDPHNNTAITWDSDRIAVRSIGQSSFSTALFNGWFLH